MSPQTSFSKPVSHHYAIARKNGHTLLDPPDDSRRIARRAGLQWPGLFMSALIPAFVAQPPRLSGRTQGSGVLSRGRLSYMNEPG
jgi:hypothetical protein